MNISHLTFLFKRLALIEAIILIGVLIVCGIAGWHSVNNISTALFAVGVIIFSIGPFAMVGGEGHTRNMNYQLVQSMREKNFIERVRQDKADQDRATGLVLPSVLIGILTILLSVAIRNIL